MDHNEHQTQKPHSSNTHASKGQLQRPCHWFVIGYWLLVCYWCLAAHALLRCAVCTPGDILLPTFPRRRRLGMAQGPCFAHGTQRRHSNLPHTKPEPPIPLLTVRPNGPAMEWRSQVRPPRSSSLHPPDFCI